MTLHGNRHLFTLRVARLGSGLALLALGCGAEPMAGPNQALCVFPPSDAGGLDAGKPDAGDAASPEVDADVVSDEFFDGGTGGSWLSAIDASQSEDDAGSDAGNDPTKGPFGDPLECASCEETINPESAYYHARAACLAMEGKAEMGIGAGRKRSVLCTDLLKCIWRTGCTKPDESGTVYLTDCLCGPGVESTTCLTTPLADAAGACVREITAASEAEMDGIKEVQNRFLDPTYPIGLAEMVIEGDGIFCPTQCFF
ncbi:MAG: hypothetical protein QM778_28995 [Myxococcales bacterium]